MTSPRFNALLAGCLGVALLAISSTWAASGRIAFTGAVITPTCGVVPDRMLTLAEAVRSQPIQMTCDELPGARVTPRVYSLKVTPLSPDDPNRLLAYFADYATDTAGTSTVRLVTQVYE